jgi:MFS family permease
MKAVYRAVMSIIACGLFGAGSGAIAGAAYGTLIVPVAGTLVGLVFGCVYGFAAGVVGGSLGGCLGWSLGGLLGGSGILTLPLLSAWGNQRIDVRLLAFWLWVALPGLIGAALGLWVGRELQSASANHPAVLWLRGTTSPCAVGEWLWWRRGISDSPPQVPSPALRWVLILCLAGLLLATRSCPNYFQNSNQVVQLGQR